MSQNEVLKLALHLKADEKFLIIDELLKSLDNADKNIDGIWEEEAISRLEAYEDGRLETVSEEEFFNYEHIAISHQHRQPNYWIDRIN